MSAPRLVDLAAKVVAKSLSRTDLQKMPTEIVPIVRQHMTQARQMRVFGAGVQFDMQGRVQVVTFRNLGVLYTAWITRNNDGSKTIERFIAGRLFRVEAYWSTGHAAEIKHVLDNQLHGQVRKWGQNGNIKYDVMFRNGMQNSTASIFVGGRLAETAEYRGGLLHGPRYQAYVDGWPMCQAQYRMGTLHGTSIDWHAPGIPWRCAEYRLGWCQSQVYWNIDGEVTFAEHDV